LLDPTSPAVHGKLELAGPPAAASCGLGASGALFHAIEVPAGHLLVARATVTAGERPWTPRLAALGACDGTACLAQGSVVSGMDQRLTWINNGNGARRVTLAVSADGPVPGAELDLTVGLTNLFATCANGIPVQDGTTLVNLSLANVQPRANPSCGSDPALYYVATLLPQQELEVVATPIKGFRSASIGLRTSCNDGCNSQSPRATTINLSTETKTVLIELTPSGPAVDTLFDVHVSMPPPRAGIAVTPTSPLVTTEGGGKATFAVVLASPPTAGVSVGVASDRPGEGAPSPGTLVFDATNWHQPQIVTVTGADDHAGDGAQRYAIVTAPATSDDARYDKLDAEDVPLTNLDDDPSVRIEGAGDLVTSEDGGSATFSVRLESPPTAPVTIPLASSDQGEGVVSPASLTFSPGDWNLPHLVTLTGVDDGAADGTQAFTVDLGTLVSDDARYGGLRPAALAAHNRDNDLGEGATKFGGAGCGIAGTPNQFPVAMDTWGGIYVVISCSGQLLLFTSVDGGITFSEPIEIPGAKEATASFSVAAGRGGTAYVVFSAPGRGLQLTRTEDAGKTWRQRELMPLMPDLIRIDAAGDTVVIGGTSRLPGGRLEDASVVLSSLDGGRSFPSQTKLEGQVTALAVGPDGKSVWLVDDRAPSLWKSGDGGATFRNIGPIAGGPVQECCYVFGARDVYAIAPGQVIVASLDDATKSAAFAVPLNEPRAAVIDDANVVTIMTSNVMGLRFGAGDPPPTASIPISFNLVGAVALSRHATGFVGMYQSGVQFVVETWP
jgi:hypothetical protein